MPNTCSLVLAAAAAAAACGCRSEAKPRLMLYCGAGIKPVAEVLIGAFEAEHAGVKIEATYAGSGRLLGQMVSHPSGDLFMPGAQWYVDRAVEKGLAEKDTQRIVAWFIPVIFVQSRNPKGIRVLGDLARPGLRVGLGDERACAVGRKALAILAKSNLPADLGGNVVYKSGTVNELPLAVELKNVDAVICWDANARHFAAHGEIVPIPPERNEVSAVPIVLLKSSQHAELARGFMDFVTSEKGKRLLREKGYTVTAPATAPAAPAPAPDTKGDSDE